MIGFVKMRAVDVSAIVMACRRQLFLTGGACPDWLRYAIRALDASLDLVDPLDEYTLSVEIMSAIQIFLGGEE